MTIERFKPKTFTVPTENGPEEAIQHATFTFYIQRQQFRFVVTQLPARRLRRGWLPLGFTLSGLTVGTTGCGHTASSS